MMEAHLLVIIDRWGKCRLSTVPLKTGNDGTTAGLPQALAAVGGAYCGTADSDGDVGGGGGAGGSGGTGVGSSTQ